GQLVKGLELAKAMNPNPAKGETNAMDFLKLMKELVIEGVRDPVMQAIKETRPSPGVFEQILTTPELRASLKEIGMFGGGSGAATSNIDLEIEKLRGERQFQVTKMEMEMRRDELKRQADDRRAENLIAVFGPLAAAFGGPAAQRMRALGQQRPYAHNPAGMQPEAMPTTNTILIRCSCGYEGSMTFPGPPPDKVNCPECGHMLVVGGIPSDNGKPEETDTGTRV
ncbi:unnamed protein product, partial [marine sediment metagenome]